MRGSAAPAIFLWLAAQTDPLVLRARWVIDVESGHAIENGSVAVDGYRVQAQAPATARVIDLGNLTLLPGLIDAHVHLMLAGEPEANARATLLAGFTTVQDLGAVGYRNLELSSIGLSRADTIRTATLNAARAVGLEDQVGTLRPGAFADVIGVDGNPLSDLDAIGRVKFDMKAGRIFLAP